MGFVKMPMAVDAVEDAKQEVAGLSDDGVMWMLYLSLLAVGETAMETTHANNPEMAEKIGNSFLELAASIVPGEDLQPEQLPDHARLAAKSMVERVFAYMPPRLN